MRNLCSMLMIKTAGLWEKHIYDKNGEIIDDFKDYPFLGKVWCVITVQLMKVFFRVKSTEELANLIEQISDQLEKEEKND